MDFHVISIIDCFRNYSQSCAGVFAPFLLKWYNKSSLTSFDSCMLRGDFFTFRYFIARVGKYRHCSWIASSFFHPGKEHREQSDTRFCFAFIFSENVLQVIFFDSIHFVCTAVLFTFLCSIRPQYVRWHQCQGAWQTKIVSKAPYTR